MTEVDEVRAANDSFYAALEGLDAARMNEVGLHESTVRCIHPGADAGWRMIHHHASPAPMKVTQPFSGTVQ